MGDRPRRGVGGRRQRVVFLVLGCLCVALTARSLRIHGRLATAEGKVGAVAREHVIDKRSRFGKVDEYDKFRANVFYVVGDSTFSIALIRRDSLGLRPGDAVPVVYYRGNPSLAWTYRKGRGDMVLLSLLAVLFFLAALWCGWERKLPDRVE